MFFKIIFAVVTFTVFLFPSPAAAGHEEYAVLVSKMTLADEAWTPVVEALVKKHEGKIITYDTQVESALSDLREQFPKYVCIVAKHGDAGQAFVASVHRMMRKLDDDPYTDVIWGILTGYDAAGALKVAKQETPLIIRKVASGTEVELAACEEGLWYCELNQGHMVRKLPGEEPVAAKGPADSTKALVDSLNDYKADLFVTSGHATERDWQIGFRYKNGYFRSKGGELFGIDTKGERYPIDSPNPKVYMPIGNCLMGHIDGPDAMALAFMNSAGVHQMLGYTKVTWYGYGGWGCLDYFVEQPGRYTFAAAFHANHHALIHRLEQNFPGMSEVTLNDRYQPSKPLAMSPKAAERGLAAKDGIGLIFDRDIVAFYGDPAWDARMADGVLAFEQTLEVEGNQHTLTIHPNRGNKSFAPVNTNGSQRGGRPILQFLPNRVKDVQIIEGAELEPVITDDFILIPIPTEKEINREYKLVFTAEPL